MHKAAIFPSFYLPPIGFFSALQHNELPLFIDKREHFPKQTYRNRAGIHSPNGKLDLIVPVVKGANVHTPVKDVKISYEFNWQRLHWLSLQTSYRSSAYFEFYEDDFAPFYHQKWTYLFDFNIELTQLLIKRLKLNAPFEFTSAYEEPSDEIADFRSIIHPKKESIYPAKAYFQVFEDRNGFIPDLSVVDLLFNQGPQSTKFL